MLLLVPFIAMQVSGHVKWGLGDFIILGLLVFGVGLITAFLMQYFKDSKYKLLIILLAIIIVALIWVELGVGLFGSPFAGD